MEGRKKNLLDYVAHLLEGKAKDEEVEKQCVLCKMARQDHTPCDACPAESEGFELWDENVDAASLFSVSLTQMTHRDGVAWGFHYPGVELARRWSGIKMTPELFESLRLCELEYCRLKNAPRGENGDRSSPH